MKIISFTSDCKEVGYIQLWTLKLRQKKKLLKSPENVFPSTDISQYHIAITDRKAKSPKTENLLLALNGQREKCNKIKNTTFTPCTDTG